jgi:xylulose-5-phosphate/fructose-6-phosphate phosphoketolase
MYRFDATISSAIEAERPGSVEQEPRTESGPLSPELLDRMHRYWQAANYLTVGQIYLRENPLLRQPLRWSISAAPARALGTSLA